MQLNSKRNISTYKHYMIQYALQERSNHYSTDPRHKGQAQRPWQKRGKLRTDNPKTAESDKEVS